MLMHNYALIQFYDCLTSPRLTHMPFAERKRFMFGFMSFLEIEIEDLTTYLARPGPALYFGRFIGRERHIIIIYPYPALAQLRALITVPQADHHCYLKPVNFKITSFKYTRTYDRRPRFSQKNGHPMTDGWTDRLIEIRMCSQLFLFFDLHEFGQFFF